jgi:hypothetical protein
MFSEDRSIRRLRSQWLAEALAVSTKTAGYDTNPAPVTTRPSKLLRDLVDLVGFEPATSSRPFNPD